MSPDARMSQRPWWKEPYVWMVIGGPLSAVIGCLVTAIYIFQGPDRLKPDDAFSQSTVIREALRQADGPRQPALLGRNHSATGGIPHAKP
jgi:uncharacterized protein